ncbi:MAG: ATP-binding protein [Planctomycetes bacterium]|nr:ATP-binding protein [Planctomycetota bacterium]
MYKRLLLPHLQRDPKSMLLLGPRQVGKSTLLESLKPDLSVDLASPSVFRDYVTDPARLERELAAAGPTVRTVLIDEVQKVPALLDVVQVFSDRHKGRFRFLLSGSSARKLKRGHANLLPGRIHIHRLHPLLQRELEADFSLVRVLTHGTLPGIYSEKDASVRSQDLRSYVDAYLREEIQAEALVRDLGGYARLLDLAAAASGTILNLSALCREAGIGYETARRYLEVLEDTLLLFRVPAWSGSDRASLVAHPKRYLFDIGVRNALLRRPLDRFLEDEKGLLLEHWIAQEIHGRTETLWPGMSLFHYRTKHGAEVDFVLEIGRETWAVEVKASRQVSAASLAGFSSLAPRVKRLTRRIVVFLGERRQKMGDVDVIPLEGFLGELPA